MRTENLRRNAPEHSDFQPKKGGCGRYLDTHHRVRACLALYATRVEHMLWVQVEGLILILTPHIFSAATPPVFLTQHQGPRKQTMAERVLPAYVVGNRLQVRWPLSKGLSSCTIVSINRKEIRRKRTLPSKFRYLLQWDDGSPPRWSRLLHLETQLLEDGYGVSSSSSSSSSIGAHSSSSSSLSSPLHRHPWSCASSDHAETPALAYSHLVPILRLLSSSLGTTLPLKIYDPFYCAGSTPKLLSDLGFPDVINLPVDFYKSLSSTPPDIPPFDVLISNPPFSEDHPRRSVNFALASGRPFFLLLPNFEACSSWLDEELRSSTTTTRLLFLAPHKRYVCRSPPSLRAGGNKSLKYVAPFPLLWIIGVPDAKLRARILAEWRDVVRDDEAADKKSCEEARDEEEPSSSSSSSISWACPSIISLEEDWRLLPPSSRPRGSKDAPSALFKSAFNDHCRTTALGQVCASFAFTSECGCDKNKTPFVHEPILDAEILADFLRDNQELRPPEEWKPMRGAILEILRRDV